MRIVTALVLIAAGSWGMVHTRPGATEQYLFVWAGDQARTSPDFLAVIDFDPDSSRYGEVMTTRRLPGPGATGNEPHHVGLSRDGRTLALGGLLSVLKGQDEIFFYDVSRPASPRFISSANPPESSITDEFYPIPGGGFLVTMMGGAEGHHPGRVVEFDSQLRLVAEHPARPPDDGFNPHGISVSPDRDLMVTSDFICPSTTLHAVPGNLDLRGSIRVWTLHNRKIVKTIPIPGAGGTIDVKLIPRDRHARAYTAGMVDDKLYLVDNPRRNGPGGVRLREHREGRLAPVDPHDRGWQPDVHHPECGRQGSRCSIPRIRKIPSCSRSSIWAPVPGRTTWR